MTSPLYGTKPSDAIPPSDSSFSFTTDGLDSRLLPTLARTTEWKDQPRIAAAHAFPSSSTTRSGSPHASSTDNGKRDSFKPRTSSISRFFHHHHAPNPIRDSVEAIGGVQAGAAPRLASRRARDGGESPRRGSRGTTDSGYSSSRRPSVSSDGSSYSSSITGLDDDARSENTSSGPSSPSQSSHSSTRLDSLPTSPNAFVRDDRDERTPVASTSQTSYFDRPSSTARGPQRPPTAPIRRPSATPTLLRRAQSAEDVRSPAPLYADLPSPGAADDVHETGAGPVEPRMSTTARGKLSDSLATPPAGRSRQPSVSQQQRRPRSMHETSGAPPKYDLVEYPTTSSHYHSRPVTPRDDEGHEGLPQYSNTVHLEGYFHRKDEFSAPGIQSRDRSWKRQYIVIRGTSIKIYKHDLRTHPIEGEVDSLASSPASEPDPDISHPDYFHRGEYGATPLPTLPVSLADARGRLSRHNALLRSYSLQNAESGVATDYFSREFVVRIRAEGEQFLLQAQDTRGVVDLIETLQAATNVALDLDQRNLPVVITIPRRRRRVQIPPAPDGGQVASGVRTPPRRPGEEHRTGF